MNISLNEQLKKLRREKGNTQEDLATHLGITIQAVSKWERGEGYPDITLLPSIASFYGVSIDDLLGVGKIEREKRLEEYLEKNAELFHNGKTSERVSLWREARREFPNDLSVICELMSALDDEGFGENADEVIELGERILDESANSTQRGRAIQSLCFTYYYVKGDAASAKRYAQMAGDYSVTRNEMIPHFLDGDEAVEYCQRNIQRLVAMIGHNTRLICRKGEYTPEETVKACQFEIDCYDLLYTDGNCGFYHVRYSEAYLGMARNYLRLGEKEKAVDCIEKALGHAKSFDELKDGMFTSFMVNKLEISSILSVKNHEQTQTDLILREIKKDAFSEMHHEPRIKALLKSLD